MSTDTEPETPAAKQAAAAMAPSQSWEPSKKLSPRKRRRYVRLAVLATIVAIYLVGYWYFSSHFVPGTTVDGVDASMMSTDELSDALVTHAEAYQQHVSNADGFDLTITGTDIGLSFDGDQVAEQARNRTSALLWPGYLLAPQHLLIDGQVTTNEEAFAGAVAAGVAAYNEQAAPPTNATAAFSEEQDAFVTVPEAVGTALDPSKVLEACTIATRELRQEVTLDEDALAQPAVTEDNETLLASIDEANKIINNGDLNVDCNGQTVAVIDRATLISWFSFDDEQHFKISGAGDWVDSNDAIKYAGNAVDEEHVWALDFQATVDDIHRALEQELGTPAEVQRYALETKPAATPGAKERGRHIDINLSTQYARFYDSDGSVIWESYFVSGGWDTEFQEMHSTPTGNFAIEAKETNRTLVGADRNNDEKPDYESFVYFWMPFLNNDYGLHDATWRGDFGGDIRYWWGSHGCVNLPYDKAEELFNLVNVGDEVYVHE